jgi:ketosteroid isomerase-like protein
MFRRERVVVRQPIAVRVHSRRRFEERLGLRFPRAVALGTRLVWRLPPRSRLRQAILRRVVVSGWEAMNRRDLDAAFALYHADVESIIDPRLVGVGFEHTRGREARVGVQQDVLGEFRDFRFESEELVDVGDGRVLVIGRMKGSGVSSGAPFDQDWAAVFTVAAGRVIHEQVFLDRSAALEAVGLAE